MTILMVKNQKSPQKKINNLFYLLIKNNIVILFLIVFDCKNETRKIIFLIFELFVVL